MKQLLLLASILISFLVNAQELKNDRYYYKGKEVTLPVNYNSFFIAANTDVNLSTVFQQYGYNIEIDLQGNDGDQITPIQYWKLIHITNATLTLSSYNTLRNQLKDNDGLTVEAVIGDSPLRPLTHYFYVRLKAIADTTILDSMVVESGAAKVTRLANMPLWFQLKVNENSLGNSLELANYFYETTLFEDVDPGFMFFFDLGCSTVSGTVNEPHFGAQWGLKNTGRCGQKL